MEEEESSGIGYATGARRGGMFKKRFLYFLKVGTRVVLPTKIHLHDRKNFTEEDLEELLGMIEKHVVAKYVRRVEGRYGDLMFAEMRNTTKKERQEFAARCTPFKRSSCVSARLRFGYYFHEEPYGQPVVLTPLEEEEEGVTVLIDLVERKAMEERIAEQNGNTKPKASPADSSSAAKGNGDIAVMMAAAASRVGPSGVANNEKKNVEKSAVSQPSKAGGMKQLSLRDSIRQSGSGRDDTVDSCATTVVLSDEEQRESREEATDVDGDEEGDQVLSSQEELALLLEVGKEDESDSVMEERREERDTQNGEGDLGETVAHVTESSSLSVSVTDGVVSSTATATAVHSITVEESSHVSFGAGDKVTVSLLEDGDDEALLSSSPMVKQLEEEERALTQHMTGKGQKRWKEMRTLPYTLMVFTRPKVAPMVAAAAAKASKAARPATPPPISISSYFGMGKAPTKRKRSQSPG
eukprot:CAMPEP_0114607996 /NCGR_PEP_ID=MMETSP0168-20121206/2352_1 /TAXON_ID=95228 ORGANISM="Vannella sp., Strain DIVA3 517/6/12" /NCGR_SAMPLE_ID=MMETSP0168 /ASSEMBLY_ACC=CAM_ASM_000044 /LENGTH=467 /DNA_ID=CAMNT_0001818883 /DNA_START=138 /DNA_END=1537 /DNA_ORIENTATION=-